MILRIAVSFLIFLLTIPVMIVSAPVVALLLLTRWGGRTTWFGNAKWGRATYHPDHATDGSYWAGFNWLVLRNPINNFLCHTLALRKTAYIVKGNRVIGDKIAGGFYRVRMGWAWEYYWIAPYTFLGRRCIRVRIGWKILNSDSPCQFCFVVNPIKPYLGA